MQRAAKARKAPSSEDLQLEAGDLVGFYKPGKPPKDVPNWKGPATVASAAAPETGNLTIQRQGRELSIKATDVRRAILSSYAVAFVATENDPAQTLIDFVHSIGDGFEHLGWASSANGWALTKVSQRYPRIVAAMLQVASCGLHLNGVAAARVGRKVPTLPGLRDFE